MSDVYVPFKDISSYSYYYYSNDLSLIYATNDNINYDIVDLKNHYSIVNSDLNLNQNDLILIDNNLLTNNWTYRNDLDSVLICFMFFILFFVGIPLFLLSRFFKKKW